MTVLLPSLTDFFCSGFAILDAADPIIHQHHEVPAKEAAAYVISQYVHETSFACNDHVKRCTKFAGKILTNVFYNNKQKIANDAVKKDTLLQFKKGNVLSQIDKVVMQI